MKQDYNSMYMNKFLSWKFEQYSDQNYSLPITLNSLNFTHNTYSTSKQILFKPYILTFLNLTIFIPIPVRRRLLLLNCSQDWIQLLLLQWLFHWNICFLIDKWTFLAISPWFIKESSNFISVSRSPGGFNLIMKPIYFF